MPEAHPRPAAFYENLNAQLRALVLEGHYKPGERFPTEREISAKFKTSRPTANKALASLVSEGLLEFRKGVGTFVQSGVLDYDLRRLVSFTEKARAIGRTPSTKVLSMDRNPDAIPPEAGKALGEQPLTYVERLRFADEVPVILERRFIASVHCPSLKKTSVKGSLYQIWTEEYGLKIQGADEVIRAVNLNKSEAELLGLPVRTACLNVISTGYLVDGQPLWWEDTLYRSDAYEFRNTLGGIHKSKPAVGTFTTKDQRK